MTLLKGRTRKEQKLDFESKCSSMATTKPSQSASKEFHRKPYCTKEIAIPKSIHQYSTHVTNAIREDGI